jgi:hypothetical protein
LHFVGALQQYLTDRVLHVPWRGLLEVGLHPLCHTCAAIFYGVGWVNYTSLLGWALV